MTLFRILGPLEVQDEGRLVPLGGTKQRAVLAILLVNRGEVVSVDRLADELWGDQPPDTATKTVQVYVSRLRKELGQDVLLTRGGGYLLDIEPAQLDAALFERLTDEGRAALERGEANTASDLLREALALWRGTPLGDLAYEPFAQSEIARLEELRLVALEHRVDADLELGEAATLIPELETLVREHPARERLRAQLILALYRSGRQSDALASYRDARRTLVEELGIEPGRELRELERAVLAQDPEIDAPARPTSREASVRKPGTRSRRPRAGVIVAVGGGLLLVAAAAAVFAGEPDPTSAKRASGNSLAVIDPDDNRVVASIPTGVRPAQVAAGAGYLWVANLGDDTVTQIAPKERTVVSTTSPGMTVGGVTADTRGVWIGDIRRTRLVRLDPSFRRPSVVRSVRVAPFPEGFGQFGQNPMATGYGSVWSGRAFGAIAGVDAESEDVVARTSVGNDPSAIAAGAGSVWVTDSDDNTVTRLDPASEGAVIGTTSVGQGPAAVAVGAGARVGREHAGQHRLADRSPHRHSHSHHPRGPAADRCGRRRGSGVGRQQPERQPGPHRSKHEARRGDGGTWARPPRGWWSRTDSSGSAFSTGHLRSATPAKAPGGVARLLVADDSETTDPALDVEAAASLRHLRAALQLRGPAVPRGSGPPAEVARGRHPFPRTAHVHLQHPAWVPLLAAVE